MDKITSKIIISGDSHVDETMLFNNVAAIIENRKLRAQVQANQESVIMFWEVVSISALFYWAENELDMASKLL